MSTYSSIQLAVDESSLIKKAGGHQFRSEDLTAPLTEGSQMQAVEEALGLHSATMRVTLPQSLYEPKNKYFGDPHDIVIFRVNEDDGIRISDASSGNCPGLEGADLGAFDEMNCLKASLRVLFEGYAPYTRQINVRDSTKQRNSITVCKTAEVVAKEIDRIFRDIAGTASELQFGNMVVKKEDLILVKIMRVSESSIQPVFAVDFEG